MNAGELEKCIAHHNRLLVALKDAAECRDVGRMRELDRQLTELEAQYREIRGY